MEELRRALESNEKLQRNYKRLEQKREELISERTKSGLFMNWKSKGD